jgi:pimeloyl-ACP methyl ester carboxylesterase
MYHEVHGDGPPVVLLHGAYMHAEHMAPLAAALAPSRRVVVPEMQNHGRTADVDRPITYEQMADDTAALIDQLGLGRPDVVGYSMGAGIGLQLAIRHPGALRRLVAASGSYAYEGMHPAAIEMFPSLGIEMFEGTPMELDYRRLAPNPDDFPVLFEKLKTLDTTPFAWPEEDVRGIAAPTLLIFGDSDVVTLEHATALFRLLGGGVMGDLAGLPASQLAVLPGTTHYMPPGHGVMDRLDWFEPMIQAFLDAE